MRCSHGFLVVAVLLLFMCACPAQAANIAASAPYVDGEVLVQFQPGASAAASAIHRMIGSRVIREIRGSGGVQLVRLPEGVSVPEAIAMYKAYSEVATIEPNYVRRPAITPNDQFFNNLWNFLNRGQTGGTIDADIDLVDDPLIGEDIRAWEFTTGSPNVVIAIVDSGIDYMHPDLFPNIWMNMAEIPANGKDDDFNGYIDDVYGINARIDDLVDPAAGDPLDIDGHGTHVAGIIGAQGNNSIGIAGVNWDVRLMGLKFLEGGTGTTADEIECFYYVAGMVDRGENIVAVNASFGGFFASSFEVAAIDALRQRGVLLIASAGNDAVDNDAFMEYPASYPRPNIVAVAATNDDDILANFSNYGNATVHTAAPGVNVWSTFLNGQYGPVDSGMSGTSMAAPHVTGVAGLLYTDPRIARDPLSDWSEVRNLLITGGELDQYLVGLTMNGRRLNAFRSLNCAGIELAARLRPATSSTKVWLSGTPEALEIWGLTIPDRKETTLIFGSMFTNSLRLSALHVNCGTPATTVDVQIGTEVVTLQDDGNAPIDHAAGDGVYSGSWTPPRVETSHTAAFPNVGTVTPVPDTFTIHVRRSSNPFVVADAGGTQFATVGQTDIMLDGSISSGLNSQFHPLFYLWEQVDGPAVTLKDDPETPYDDAVSPFPLFDAPATAEPVTFRLTVSDLEGNEDVDLVSVSFSAPLTTINLLTPPDLSTLFSPPTFQWSVDGGINNAFTVDVSPFPDFRVFWTTFSFIGPIRGTSWAVPPPVWNNRVNPGQQLYWRVRGTDLAVGDGVIIESSEVFTLWKALQ